MAYTLIGGTAVGTALILLFLPALYAAWFAGEGRHPQGSEGGTGIERGRDQRCSDFDAKSPNVLISWSGT